VDKVRWLNDLVEMHREEANYQQQKFLNDETALSRNLIWTLHWIWVQWW